MRLGYITEISHTYVAHISMYSGAGIQTHSSLMWTECDRLKLYSGWSTLVVL